MTALFKQLCPHLNQSQTCFEVWRQRIALQQPKCALRKCVSLTQGLSPGMQSTASQLSTAAKPSEEVQTYRCDGCYPLPHLQVCQSQRGFSLCSSKTRLGPWTYVGRGLIQSTEDGTLTITEITSGIASPPNSSGIRNGLTSAPRSQPRHHSPAGATLSVNQGIRLHSTSFSEHRQSFQDMRNETRYRYPLLPRWGALLGHSAVKP